MKRFIIKKIVVAITLVLLILTPSMNRLANESRGVNGFGGECLIWAVPMLMYGLVEEYGG